MRIPAILRGRRRALFARLVANGVAQAAVTFGTVLLVRLAFDRLIRHAHPLPFQTMLWVGVGLASAAVGMSWLKMMERIDAERMGQSYAHRIRMRLFDHLSTLAPRALQRRSRGATVLRFVGDLNALRRWVSLGVVRLSVAAVSMVGALAALSIINWVLALGVAVVLTIGTLHTVHMGRQLREVVKESRRRRSYLAANVNEKIASMAVVQVFGQSDRERRRLRRQSRRLRNARVDQARKLGLIRAIAWCTTALASGAVLLLGANEVASGRASPGTVVAAITIVGLLRPSMRGLGRVYEYWHEAQVSMQKIREFLKTPSLVNEVPDAPDLEPGPGRLEFDGASLLGSVKEVTAVAEPGTVVALVGPNGAGKSTVALLAARLIDPDEGKVLLNGQDIAKHSLASVRRTVGMVSPDLPLLRGTVEKNLRYRWPDAPAEEIARVKAWCEIDKVVAELPDGEQTRLTEDGGNLSLGQRQRIALARALLGNPSILLLDEADAHLDHESNALLDRILAQYRGTVLLVTHRPERMANADVMWRMEEGLLVEVGTPASIGGGVPSSGALLA